MDMSHMLNLRNYLLRNAERLYVHKAWLLRKRAGLLGAILEFKELPQDPEQWIRSTPFFIQLTARILNAGSIPPDSLEIDQNKPLRIDRGS